MTGRTNYHLELGGELTGFTSTHDRNGCRVEQFTTIGGRTVRFVVNHERAGVPAARADYWNGAEWVTVSDLPRYFPAGSGTAKTWADEWDLTEPIDSDTDRITLGAQTALEELYSRAAALLAPSTGGQQ